MHPLLTEVINSTYNKYSLQVFAFENEPESKEYDACQFKLNGQSIIYRSSKITPKKVGQFVTFWKRNANGITEPLHENDPFDFYIINVIGEKKHGQFILPKAILVEKGITSTKLKDGKRGFRVYPPWDTPTSKQAMKTQQWQIRYFVEINGKANLKRVEQLLDVE